jgi:hypothetical protein
VVAVVTHAWRIVDWAGILGGGGISFSNTPKLGPQLSVDEDPFLLSPTRYEDDFDVLSAASTPKHGPSSQSPSRRMLQSGNRMVSFEDESLIGGGDTPGRPSPAPSRNSSAARMVDDATAGGGSGGSRSRATDGYGSEVFEAPSVATSTHASAAPGAVAG